MAAVCLLGTSSSQMQQRHLDILGMLASQASKQHPDESARHEIEEAQSHRRIIP
jgi:hypothetical protein